MRPSQQRPELATNARLITGQTLGVEPGPIGWLESKRALVIGAGSGIGRAVVDAFRTEGANVGMLEIDVGKCRALNDALPQSPVVVGDASTYGANQAAVAAMVDRFDGLDILVNCVGVFDFYQGIEALDPRQFDDAFAEIFRVNVASQMLSVKAALPALRASRGNVVLTGSTSSFYPGRGGVLYVASKFAVRGLVLSLAHELAPEIRVNGVAPGGTLGTDLRGAKALGLGGEVLGDNPDRAAELRRRTPLDVALNGADHAWSYVYLASERSRGVTGTFVHSDGGIGIKA